MSQLLSKVTHMLQFLHQMFNLFALLLDDALKPATPLTNGAIDETLQQFAPLIDHCLLPLVYCLESSTLIDHLLKGTPNSAIDWIQVRAVWGALQQMLCQRRRFTTLNQLKQAIVIEWDKLLQRFIDRAIGQWCRRLE